MKRFLLFVLLIVPTAWAIDNPFNRGVNLTGWLQTSSAQQIQFTKFTKQDFSNIKSLGCDVIRLPINLHYMTNGAPDYLIDPLFYYFLDQIVNWAEELDLHLILDNHSFDPAIDTNPNVVDILIPVWTQMAEHFKDRSTNIHYEVLNEPHGIADNRWNEIQQQVIDAIRAVDQKHTIVIGPAGWNSYNNLKYMPEYEDDNLIYTFHFYDPFLFTHQGASWTDPSLAPLAGVPFPYDAACMPDCPSELLNTWVSGSLSNYRNEGRVERVKDLIDIAVDFQTSRHVPLFCGEFGVYIPNSDKQDRVYWYNIVQSYLEEKDIAWTIWDYTGGFGLFEFGTSELFDCDLNIPLIEALGLNPPEQKEFVLTPDSTGFELYMDYIAPRVFESSWAADGIVNYYWETNPVAGRYCIYWTEVEQYNHIGFDFKPIKDLSILVEEGYAIDFWVRGESPQTRFDIRFIDTKTDDPDDHPWRMRMTIDETRATWNGEWNHLQIPLKDFTEHGSWDNGWFNPQGDFDWTVVDRFEIVSEHHNLKGIQFWFDNIRIVDPRVIGVNDDSVCLPNQFMLEQNYPNQFNPTTIIN
jgi:endoglucanase